VTPEQTQIVKSTVPVLQSHGEEITRVFYRQLLDAHPELNAMFNADRQQDGTQARRLAGAILAYAGHVDRVAQLDGAVGKIARTHVGLKVLPEQYPIVGEHLLGAIQSVLGEAAEPEILEAWAAAYGQLAEIMIEREASLYSAAGANQS